MWQKVRRFFTSSIRNKLLLGIMAVSLLPLFGAMLYSIETTKKMVYGFVLREQEHYVHTLASDVDRFLSGVREDVLFLSRADGLARLLQAQADGDAAGEADALRTVAHEFLNLSQVRGVYYQVRYLDATGMEVVRIDSDGKQVFAVPQDQLQDKAGRYYFTETMATRRGEVWVSPLDLNVEHGEIERPFKPVIRYATPVWFDNRPSGIVIVNVFASYFLDALGAKSQLSELVVMIDEDGYYLYHSQSPEKRWGRDLETGITIGQEYPDVASMLFSKVHEKNEHGVVRLEPYFATFTSLAPKGTDRYRWAIVSFRSADEVLAPLLQYEWVSALILALSISAVIGLGLWSSLGLVRPIRQLGRLAHNLGQGDLDTAITVSSTDEIGALANVLDRTRQALRQTSTSLQSQVRAERQHAAMLQAATEVGSAMASILDAQELLSRVAGWMCEQFEVDYAAVFMLDLSGEWVELQAAAGRGSRRVLAQGYRLPLDGAGLVSVVASGQDALVVADADLEPAYVRHPHVVDMRSELALPLRARGQVLGVLDLHARRREAFTREEVVILQTLANQMAMAISNIWLFQESRDRLEAVQRAFGEYGREVWAKLAQERELGRGYRYGNGRFVSAEGVWRPEMALAVRRNQTVKDETDGGAAAVPIRIRDQVIGVIDARKREGAGGWSAAELELFEVLIDRLGQALDSAQLYESTQQQAAREQAVGQISAEFARTLDLDTLLRTAVRELGQLPNVTEVSVHIDMPEIASPDSRENI